MIPRYDNRQPIPENVIQALCLTAKVGFLTRELWYEFFGQGNHRWQERHFQKLVEGGYLAKHRNAYAKGVFVLTELSHALVRVFGVTPVSPVPVMYLAHDGVVARSMLALKRERVIREFNVEREMKTLGIGEFLLGEKDHDRKYPDAVFKMNALGKERTVALEYEREQKSSSRYRTMLTQYAGVTNLSLILVIFERSAIKKAIENAKKYVGRNEVLNKLAFVAAEDWQRNPLDAEIEMPSGRTTLRKMCANKNSAAA